MFCNVECGGVIEGWVCNVDVLVGFVFFIILCLECEICIVFWKLL